MAAPPNVAPRRVAATAALLYLSVAISIGALSVSRFDLERCSRGDIVEYVRLHRDLDLGETPAPYRYRALVPLLARAVPDLPSALVREGENAEAKSTVFKFAVVNLIGMTVAAFYLFRLMGAMGFACAESLLGGVLFLCSFPALTHATLPLVEAWAYAVLAGGLYALVQRNHLLLFVLFTVGMFTKETTVLVAAASLLLPAPRTVRAKQWLCFAPALLAYAFFRYSLLPTAPIYSIASTRQFAYDVFVSGDRLDLIARGVRSLGLLWLLAAYGWVLLRRQREHLLIRWSPLVPALLLVPFLLALHPVRVWFLAFPVVVPLAVTALCALYRGGVRARDPADGLEPATGQSPLA
jgi:hypothetical protein